MPDNSKFVGRDEFAAAVKDGCADGLALFKAIPTEVKAIDETRRTIDFVISTAAVDRMKDSVSVSGWNYDNFMKSPVVLWAHDSSIPPVARAVSVTKSNDALMSTALFMERDISPFADSVFRMYIGKFLSAVSVGFIPVSYSFSKEQGREYGLDFSAQELLEYSCCPVPANPEALISARAKGIDTEPLREWAEKLLDEGGSVMVPRDLLEETFRAAKTPRTVRQKYLSKDAADWKVGAARDLPVDDADAWDGPAASKRMLDAAGFDGETPDAAKAARGFLIHDAANPTLRGSYKLPFADIVGGELKAIKGGVSAAKGRLDQTDAPAPVLDDAKTVLEAYEKKVGEMVPAKAIGDGNAPTGSCGRGKDAECGMKNPAECAVHAPPADKAIAAPEVKSGRKISSANEALLRKAMDHHASATECIKAVLDSNAAAEPDGDEPDADDPQSILVPLTPEDKRAKRIREAKALKDSVQT